MTDSIENPTIIERLRNQLQPKGTAPIVQLFIAKYGFFNKDFVHECIDELDRMHLRVACGDKPTALEKLAYQVLLDSAYIDLQHEAELAERIKKYAEEK
jgi:hypothetical protein